ncbi:MAG: Rpn family recombination-promoting nuclease/putative transposase [Gammaproteobacteria bacterium]|nr:Rpn family recombination-promoting nuclease/putative transposase [Gammaproteobacteria bacterium]
MPNPSQLPEKDRVHGSWHSNFFSAHFNNPESVSSLMKLALTPEELEVFDLDTLRIDTDKLIDSSSLASGYSDLLAWVKLHGGEKLGVWILIEHKSRPDARAMVQILWYVALLYRMGRKPVIPILIYHGREQWRTEKSFHAFEHAKLPRSFLSLFQNRLIDFRVTFVSLREPDIKARLSELPLLKRVALRAMALIWDADVNDLVLLIEEARSVSDLQWQEFSASLKEYFVMAAKGVTIDDIRRSRQSQDPGDERMQQTLKDVEHLIYDTVDTAEQKGYDRGRVEHTSEIVRRMVQLGYTDEDIQAIVLLSEDEYSELKNRL